MSDKYILVSLEDSKAKKVSEILGNKTSKKILDFLADTKEASVSDISNSLSIPMNTVGYNIQKLVDVGLVEKSKNYFWSIKGKKIPTYKVSNKSIVISPKSTIKSGLSSILPVAVISGLFALLIRYLTVAKTVAIKAIPTQVYSTGVAEAMPVDFVSPWMYTTYMMPAWVWFLAGVIFGLAIFFIINFIKRKLK